MKAPAMLLLLAALFAGTASTGEGPGLPRQASFAAKPSTKAGGGKAIIAFAVDRPVDAAVWIAGADGRTVRHLAAGLLGENPPVPFRKGLAQEIEWDMTDDAGRPAAGGPFKVHVGLGTRVVFDGILCDSRESMGVPSSLTVDKDGNLFFLWQRGNPFYGGVHITRHARDGKYLGTVMPYGADLPEDKVTGFGRLKNLDGKFMPLVNDSQAQAIQSFTAAMNARQTMTFLPDGRLLMSSGNGNATSHGPAQHLLTIMPDGSCPPGGMVKMRFGEPRGYLGGTSGDKGSSPGHLAADPKGKYVYFSGVEAMDKVHHGVYRFEIDAQKALPEKAWLGDAGAPGADDSHFSSPQGIAVDAEGNLYVADQGNNRVMAFSPEGKLIGKLDVATPVQVAVHPAKKTIYVLSWTNPGKKGAKGPVKPLRKLFKFESISASGPAAEADLPAAKNPRYDVSVMTADFSAAAPRVWIAGHQGSLLMYYDDEGRQLAPGQNLARVSDMGNLTGLAADPVNDRLIVKCVNYWGLAELDLKTGKLGGRPFAKHTYAPCFDGAGNLYVYNYGKEGETARKPILRFGPDGKPLAFPGTGKNVVDPLPAYVVLGNHFCPWGGICVSPQGEVYALVGDEAGGPEGSKVNMFLDHFGTDGKRKRKDVIPGLLPGHQCVQADRWGNIYIGMNIKPAAGKLNYPPFDGQVPDDWFWQKTSAAQPLPWSGGYMNAYLFAGGAVVKFGPGGGATAWAGQKEREKPAGNDVRHWLRGPGVSLKNLAPDYFIKGAEWTYRGFSPVQPGKDFVGTDPACVCISGRFKLDFFGRLWVPDALRFSVGLVDGAGNEILRFGEYGNQDSLGAGSAQPVPPLPLYWPIDVDTKFPYAYVADYGNRRIVRAKVSYGAEENCGL